MLYLSEFHVRLSSYDLSRITMLFSHVLRNSYVQVHDSHMFDEISMFLDLWTVISYNNFKP